MPSADTIIMFHRSIDVPLLNAREGNRAWKRVWYASALFFSCISITLALGYVMVIYKRKRFSACEKQIAILSGLDLAWFFLALIFCHYRFQHHKIRMLVGEILGIILIPLFAMTVDTLDRCSTYENTEPLYSWLLGWATCTVIAVTVAIGVWSYTLVKWCCFPKGLRITWNAEANEVHSDNRESMEKTWEDTSSVDDGSSSNEGKLPDDIV